MFNFVVLWRGTDEPRPHDQVKAIHFAKSERDFNMSIRTHVEWLEQKYYKRAEGRVAVM